MGSKVNFFIVLIAAISVLAATTAAVAQATVAPESDLLGDAAAAPGDVGSGAAELDAAMCAPELRIIADLRDELTATGDLLADIEGDSESLRTALADAEQARDMAIGEAARLAAELEGSYTFVDSLSGQVRAAQSIVFNLQNENDSLRESCGGVPEGTGATSRPSAPESCDGPLAELAAAQALLDTCESTGSLMPDDGATDADLAAITAEREALQARIDAGAGQESDGAAEIAALQQQLAAITAERDGLSDQLAADQSNLSARLAQTIQERDAALSRAQELQVALSSAEQMRDAETARAAALSVELAEVQTAAVNAIGTSTGALMVCDSSPVRGAFILPTESAATQLRTGLGVLGEGLPILISNVPTSGVACVLQPIAGLLAPASSAERAVIADFGIARSLADSLPSAAECTAFLDNPDVVQTMSMADGFGDSTDLFWVMGSDGPQLCGFYRGRVGLVRANPRGRSAVLFLIARDV